MVLITLRVFLREIFENVDFEKNQQRTKKFLDTSEGAGSYRFCTKVYGNDFDNFLCKFISFLLHCCICYRQTIHIL